MAGTGEFVTVDEGNVHPWGPGGEIADTISYTRDFADTERRKLDSAIEDLKTVVGTYNGHILSADVAIPTLDGPSFPARPTFGALNLDDSWPSDLPASPLLQEYGNTDFEFISPTPPSEISGNFAWSPEDYTSDMWAALFAKVHDDIIDGGTGLTDAVHSAIVARERETRRVNQDREFQKGLNAVGATGFNLPSGHVAAFLSEYQREVLARDQDALNNITIKDFDLATENTRFAVTTGKELEQLLRATYEAAQSRGLDAAKATHGYIVDVYNANLKAYIAKWDGIRIDLESLKLKIDAISSRNEGEIKVYLGQAEVYDSQIKAIASKNKSIVDVRQGEIDVYSAEVQAVASQYGALVEEIKVAMDGTRLEIEQTIENNKINLEAYTSETGLAKEVATAISQIAAQSVASALGAINTTLSSSYGARETKAEKWTHGDRISETHSYSEV